MRDISASRKGFDNARLARISDWMQTYVEQRKFPGCTTLIRRAGEEVFFHQAGLSDIAADTPFQRDTVVRIYSMTKPITTVAAMTLFERGLFPLEAPVSAFIPEFGKMQALIPGAERLDQTEPAPSPTIHQLMTHTSGLSYGFNPSLLGDAMMSGAYDFNPDQGRLEDMAAKVAGLPLAFQPGSKWEYSVATDILGRVVEVVSGKSLGAYFQENIFEPLDMTETGFGVAPGARHRFAALYTPLAGNPMDLAETRKGTDSLRLTDAADESPFLDPTIHSGGGGLVGTIDDYMTFAEMLRTGGKAGDHQILGPKTLEFMMRNHLPGDIASMGPLSFAEQPMEGMGFGLGGAVVLDPGRTRVPGSVGDFSWGGMASTFFWVDPVLDLSVVFFTQLSPSSSYPSRAELKALVHGAILT